jgi:bacterioferritin (cytochrome b1)
LSVPIVGSLRRVSDPDPMDTEKVLEQLNVALELQLRSLLQFTQASGSMFGLELQGVTGKLWEFAQLEHEDTRLLVEKITALGGDPTTEIGELSWTPDPAEALDRLIETEDEVTEALHAVIPHSGQEAASEALEHLMEHIIMRKQNQIDWLRRAWRQP